MALPATQLECGRLQPSETRENWQDLEVITLDPQGNPAKTVYYSYDQLLPLRTVINHWRYSL